jgi:lipopolysaccharide export LptBFGC system permease protein LptF
MMTIGTTLTLPLVSTMYLVPRTLDLLLPFLSITALVLTLRLLNRRK